MDAQQVIDSYVRDVAGYLPRKKRNDVAFELGALLADELAAKAAAAGRAADAALAMELLAGFGRPAEVAARYHPRAPIVEPADNHNFLIWTVVGALLASLQEPDDDPLFLRWLGILVIVFAVMGWHRRRHPGAFTWKPRRDPDVAPRGLTLLELALTMIFPLFMYATPQTFVKVVFLNKIPHSGVVLTEAFQGSWLRMASLAALVVIVLVYAMVAVQGRWRPSTRWTSIAAHGCLGLLLLLHRGAVRPLLGGASYQVFELPKANEIAMPFFGLAALLLLLSALYEGYREWARIRPAPALDTGQPSRPIKAAL